MLNALVSILIAVSGAAGHEPARREVPPLVVTHDAAAKMAEAGVDRLKADGVAGLLELGFAPGKTINNPADRAPATEHFNKLHSAMTARYGKPTGEIEFVRKESLGASLVQFVYLEKLERTAVVWKFTFYRIDGEWKWKDYGLTDVIGPEFRVAP